MAKAESIKIVELKLTLTFEEAAYLRRYLQNKMRKDESPEEATFRADIWEALSRGLEHA